MPIIEPAIRPPSEAGSFLLQVTTGCSSNSCSFCPSYHGKKFRIKDFEEIKSDIALRSRLHPETCRVFLMDGDALVLSFDRLKPILEELKSRFAGLSRISSYANDYNFSDKTDEELNELSSLKYKLFYIGLESGSQKILDQCGKRSTAAGMTDAVMRCKKFGIKSSVIVLLGLGGRENSGLHVKETANALNRMPDAAGLPFISIPHNRQWD